MAMTVQQLGADHTVRPFEAYRLPGKIVHYTRTSCTCCCGKGHTCAAVPAWLLSSQGQAALAAAEKGTPVQLCQPGYCHHKVTGSNQPLHQSGCRFTTTFSGLDTVVYVVHYRLYDDQALQQAPQDEGSNGRDWQVPFVDALQLQLSSVCNAWCGYAYVPRHRTSHSSVAASETATVLTDRSRRSHPARQVSGNAKKWAFRM
jgi:hypothetical protein